LRISDLDSESQDLRQHLIGHSETGIEKRLVCPREREILFLKPQSAIHNPQSGKRVFHE
jgi:hypothetical protein